MMYYAVNILAVIPLRKEPSDTSEMVSQVLFGEHFTVIEQQNQWLYVELLNDSYKGWLDSKCCVKANTFDFEKFKNSPQTLVQEFFQKISTDNITFYIPMGSVLPNFVNGNFTIENKSYFTSLKLKSAPFQLNDIEHKALQFLETPYLWGGKTMFGIDCSGFTQLIFQQFGINLFRDAHQQATQGELVNFVTETQTGDLAFFENEEGKIIHVGIVLPEQKIIHAHGKVRIDSFDDTGIYNTETQKYSHRLRLIKRHFI